MPAHQVAAAAKHRPAEAVIEVASHLWPAVMLFNALQTQWRVAAVGMAGLLILGLDYQAIGPTMDLLEMQVPSKKRLMGYLQILESEARTVLNQAQQA